MNKIGKLVYFALCFLLSIILLVGCKKESKIPSIKGYSVLWNDEFDGSKLNEKIWNYEPHNPGWTNNELQEYTTSTDNVYLKDGNLVIKALKTEQSGSDYYTSGKITTKNKKDFMYGKVVVSAKVPKGQGLWPAIWMMPTDESKYGQWPKCGEIDIMEVLGSDVSTAYQTLHYGEPHGEQQGKLTLTENDFSEQFHEYSVEWEPGEFRFYIDNKLIKKINDWFTAEKGQDDKPYPAPFNQTFFMQLNLAVGGNWPGSPDATTDFNNAEFLVDYVRVYQKSSYDTNVTKPDADFRTPTADGNYIYNGNFEELEDLTDEENWKFILLNGGEGSASIDNNVLTINTTSEGTEEYSVQLVQAKLPIVKGKTYKVTFDAMAGSDRDIIVCVSAPTSGWIRYLKDTSLAVSSSWKTYSYTFTMEDKTDPNGRLEFNLGKQDSTASVSLRNVRVEEVK